MYMKGIIYFHVSNNLSLLNILVLVEKVISSMIFLFLIGRTLSSKLGGI